MFNVGPGKGKGLFKSFFKVTRCWWLISAAGKHKVHQEWKALQPLQYHRILVISSLGGATSKQRIVRSKFWLKVDNSWGIICSVSSFPEGIKDASELIIETLDGRMNRLEAYLHRMVHATEGVSRSILKQKNMLLTLGTAMAEQIHSSNSNYSKQSSTKASSPYEADIYIVRCLN